MSKLSLSLETTNGEFKCPIKLTIFRKCKCVDTVDNSLYNSVMEQIKLFRPSWVCQSKAIWNCIESCQIFDIDYECRTKSSGTLFTSSLTFNTVNSVFLTWLDNAQPALNQIHALRSHVYDHVLYNQVVCKSTTTFIIILFIGYSSSKVRFRLSESSNKPSLPYQLGWHWTITVWRKSYQQMVFITSAPKRSPKTRKIP